jgi:hypothetical protein
MALVQTGTSEGRSAMSEENGDDAWAEQAEQASRGWFDGDDTDADELDVAFRDYDITSSPNDFNITTIVDFVNRGTFLIPGFQRNYVWDIKRASRLIESLLVGLPIPQLFLYEEKRNSFLVIDGQQRLMSIYYFIRGRFPKRTKRGELRRIMAEQKTIPASVMENDAYFDKFNLDLKTRDGRALSPFNGKNYQTLEDQSVLDLRTVRNIVIKQTAPDEERASSVFEIFNRLNTGGVNLRPQEIRSSLYHSDFTEILHRVNLNPVWRRIIRLPEPDLHQKDVEILLRVFALVVDGDSYREPMSGFLNKFARKARGITGNNLPLAEGIFTTFFDRISTLTPQDFEGAVGRFNIAAFEAVFRAACTDAMQAGDPNAVHAVSAAQMAALKADTRFFETSRYSIGRTRFVNDRYLRAKAILQGV